MNVIWAHLRELVSWSYLTTRFPGDLSRPFLLGWLIIGAAAIILGMVIRLVLIWRASTPPPWARWWRKYSTMLTVAGFIVLIILFFRYERSPFLSARIIIVGWIVCVAVWKLKLLYVAWRRVPQEVAIWKERQRIAKYLPR